MPNSSLTLKKIHVDDKLASMRMFRERKSTIYPSLQCMTVVYSLICCLFVLCVACPEDFQPLSIWLIASVSSTHREPKWRPPSQSFLPWSLISWLWLCLLRIRNEPQDQPIQIFFFFFFCINDDESILEGWERKKHILPWKPELKERKKEAILQNSW